MKAYLSDQGSQLRGPSDTFTPQARHWYANAAEQEARRILSETEPCWQSCYTVVASDYTRPHPTLGLPGVEVRRALAEDLRAFVVGVGR